jgi:hypothetical protein
MSPIRPGFANVWRLRQGAELVGRQRGETGPVRSCFDPGLCSPLSPPRLHQPRGVPGHLVDLDVDRVASLAFAPGRHFQRVRD